MWSRATVEIDLEEWVQLLEFHSQLKKLQVLPQPLKTQFALELRKIYSLHKHIQAERSGDISPTYACLLRTFFTKLQQILYTLNSLYLYPSVETYPPEDKPLYLNRIVFLEEQRGQLDHVAQELCHYQRIYSKLAAPSA